MPGRRFQLLIVLLIAGCSYLPFSSTSTKSAPAAVQEDEETRISRQFRREARRQLNLLNNPEIESYVDHVGRRILSVMGPLDFEYRFFVIGDPQLNAFSVPGGSIYVYTGLMERAKSTDEIAGVMGHEIIHAKNHHMQRMSGPDPLALLGLLGMILARGGAAGQAAGAVGQALSATRQFAFSRGLELESDTLGTKYMAQAGYDPRGALSFMKTLDQQRALSQTDVPAYLLTHPVTQERIANIELIMRSLPGQHSRPEGVDPLRRIQVLISLDKQAEGGLVAAYEKVVAAEPDNAAARQFLALGQQAQGKLNPARGNYEKARSLDPRLPGIDRDLGRLYGQMGDFKLAHEAFDRALKADSREALNYLFLGELFERENNLQAAAGAYLNASNLAPLSAVVFNRLGLAYGRLNRQGEGYYYLGRSMLLMDDDEKAVADYERAIKILGPKSARAQVIREEMEAVKGRRR
ncbi:MAG TPA: M48 family metalloprotease [Candidatus Binatia bacterium]